MTKKPNTNFKPRIKIAGLNSPPETCDNCSTDRQADPRPTRFSIASRIQAFILFKNLLYLGIRNTGPLIPDDNFHVFTFQIRIGLSDNLYHRVATRIMNRIIENIIQHHLH